jgi:hypothetical protein
MTVGTETTGELAPQSTQRVPRAVVQNLRHLDFFWKSAVVPEQTPDNRRTFPTPDNRMTSFFEEYRELFLLAELLLCFLFRCFVKLQPLLFDEKKQIFGSTQLLGQTGGDTSC